ncbi:MAG: glycosyltransferase family 2 protein [Bacteroidota bacterium]
MNRPLISVVTVVYNCVDTIEKTILSVVNQTYSEIEYIIIDGGSHDGTQDKIQPYSSVLAYYHSKPDKGLYDAMNQGMTKAKGDFCLFLNAGDLFYRKNTLARMVAKIDAFDALYFATAVMTDEKNIFRLRPPSGIEVEAYLANGGLPNHQATLFPRRFYASNNYDLTFRVAADDDYKIRALRECKPIFVDCWAIVFELGGLSKSNSSLKLIHRRVKEMQKLNEKHFPDRASFGVTQLKYVIKAYLLFTLEKLFGYHWQYERWFNKFQLIPATELNRFRAE